MRAECTLYCQKDYAWAKRPQAPEAGPGVVTIGVQDNARTATASSSTAAPKATTNPAGKRKKTTQAVSKPISNTTGGPTLVVGNVTDRLPPTQMRSFVQSFGEEERRPFLSLTPPQQGPSQSSAMSEPTAKQAWANFYVKTGLKNTWDNELPSASTRIRLSGIPKANDDALQPFFPGSTPPEFTMMDPPDGNGNSSDEWVSDDCEGDYMSDIAGDEP